MGKIWSTYECPLRRIRGIQRGQDEGGGAGRKMSVFDHAQGIKTVHAGGEGVKKWQNSLHVVVECPLNKPENFPMYSR